MALAFLAALLSGGRLPWEHIPAGITVGLLDWTGLLMWAAGASSRGGPPHVGICNGRRTRWLPGSAAALLICLAGLSATGLGLWITGARGAASGYGDPAGAWALAHEGFRFAALGLLAAHLIGVARRASRHSGEPGPGPQPERSGPVSETREPVE